MLLALFRIPIGTRSTCGLAPHIKTYLEGGMVEGGTYGEAGMRCCCPCGVFAPVVLLLDDEVDGVVLEA